MDWINVIDRLNWNNDIKIIEDAKKRLSMIPDEYIHMLVLPISKYHWENSADVIVGLGVEKFVPIISDLLVWLQDLNWPGAVKIYNMLKEADNPIVDKAILSVSNIAEEEGDEEWLENINMLIEKVKIV